MSNALSVQAQAVSHPHPQNLTALNTSKPQNQKPGISAQTQPAPTPHKVDIKV
jgi:hypothetical protein